MTPYGTLGNVETLTVGGRTFVNVPSLIQVTTFTSGGVTYSTARLGNGSSGYAVTGGKTYQIGALKAVFNGSSSGGVLVGYCDNDIGLSSATTPVNPNYFIGYTGTPGPAGIVTTVNPNGQYESNFSFNVPAGKYVFVQSESSVVGYVTFFGYEV